MMKRLPLALLAPLLFALLFGAPVQAQFADQATLLTGVGSSGGGNTITATLAPVLTSYNAANGVLLKIVPNASNTGAATLNLNSLGTSPAVVKMTSSGLTALTGNGCELVNGVPALLVYLTSVSEFVLMSNSCSNVTVGSTNLLNSALGFNAPLNLTIGTSVGSNQLTLSVCANSSTLPTCTAPSSTNPLLVAFRDPTIANGDPVMRSLTSSLSFTIGSGSTMGCQNGVMCRLWLFLIDNAGTLALCSYNANNATSIVGLNESAPQTSQSGTSGGSNAQNLYCSTSAVSAKSIRYIGYIDIQETTAGTWASLPNTTQIFGPGIPRPGSVIKIIGPITNTGATTVGSTTKTVTNTTTSISLDSAANVVVVRAEGSMVAGSGSAINAQLSRGTAPTLFGTIAQLGITSEAPAAVAGFDQPNTTSSTSYFVYIWNGSGVGTSSWLGTQNSTVLQSTITIQEIMGALEPANDDMPQSKAA